MKGNVDGYVESEGVDVVCDTKTGWGYGKSGPGTLVRRLNYVGRRIWA